MPAKPPARCVASHGCPGHPLRAQLRYCKDRQHCRGVWPRGDRRRGLLETRQCPLSGLKNTDPNVIADGPWGPTFSKHAIWNRGSSQNPGGRFERISVLTWEHGGFADICPSIDDFAAKVKADSSLLKQFKAAYVEMVKIVTEGRMRFRGDQKGKCKMRLDTARKTVVSTYRSSQLNVKTKFRGVLKDVYEKQHPGRIQRKNLKVVKARPPFGIKGAYGGRVVDCCLR